MEEFLDKLPSQDRSDTFTRLSIFTSSIAIICFLVVMHQLSGSHKVHEGFPKVSRFFLGASQVFTIGSLIFLVTSFVKKEKRSWKTWFATLLGSVLFLLVFGSIFAVYFFNYLAD